MDREFKIIAEDIIEEVFGINEYTWINAKFDTQIVENFLFTEVYHISLSKEEQDKYPEAIDMIQLYPNEFIKIKFEQANQSCNHAECKSKIDKQLSKYSNRKKLYIMRHLMYFIHVFLLKKDYGDSIYSLDSDCRGLTREAETFIDSQVI